MKLIEGIGASEGIVIGEVFRYEDQVINTMKTTITDTDEEIRKLNNSLDKSRDDLIQIRQTSINNMGEEAGAIFDAHLAILEDPQLVEGIKDKIMQEKVNGVYAIEEIVKSFIAIFDSMEDAYMRERAADIRDIANRLQKHMLGLSTEGLGQVKRPVIVMASDLTPSDTASLDRRFVQGFVTDIGGRTSHSAIMARSLGIPAVTGTKVGMSQVAKGDLIILDGTNGTVIVNPNEGTIKEYERLMEEQKQAKEHLIAYKDEKTVTKDGSAFLIGANIGQLEDVDQVLEVGAEGIGLFRTEFLYMGKKAMPTEEEQFEAYRKVLSSMGEKPVVIRTLDIGGDKELDYLSLPKELNPFLGNRAIRLCFKHQEIFRIQLRALLRASKYGNLHIMIPMIATLEELRKVKALLKEIERELKEESIEAGDYQLGMMMEVPSAAIMAHAFAKEVDFFSIGTNDLIQYTFAADRMNEEVSYLYQPFHPAVLHLIENITKAAHDAGIWVGVCGEMGGELEALPLLIGLGIDEISMSASSILKMRAEAKELDLVACQDLASKALLMSTEEEVKGIL